VTIRGVGAERERLQGDGVAPGATLPCPCCGLTLAIYDWGGPWVDHPDPSCRWYIETPLDEVEHTIAQHIGLRLSRHGGAA
jgi:hypothetical protein